MRKPNLIARLLLLSSIVWCSAVLSQRPIIDMHMHAFGFDEYGKPAPANEITGVIPSFTSDEEARLGMLKEMERVGIVRAIISGPLEHVTQWRASAPLSLIGGAYTGPRDPLPTADALKKLIKEGEISLLGELGLQYLGLSPEASEMDPYWRIAVEFDIPVALHTGLGDAGTPYGCCPKFRARLGNPLLVEDVLVRYPKLRMYLMHGGYPFLQETKAILTIYPQVYVDVAVINWAIPRAEFHSYLRALIDAGFADRIMFGSDQMVWPDAFVLAIQGIETADFLTEKQKRAIYYDNAARFLRLTTEQINSDHTSVR